MLGCKEYICQGCKIICVNGADYWQHRKLAHADLITEVPNKRAAHLTLRTNPPAWDSTSKSPHLIGLSNYYVKSNTKCPTAEVLESCNEHITAHLNFAITYLELNGGENSY